MWKLLNLMTLEKLQSMTNDWPKLSHGFQSLPIIINIINVIIVIMIIKTESNCWWQTSDLLGRGTVRYWKNRATGQAGRSQAHSTSSVELLQQQQQQHGIQTYMQLMYWKSRATASSRVHTSAIPQWNQHSVVTG